MPDFGREGGGDKLVPTLRNKTFSLSKLDKLLQNETHRKIELNNQQKIQLLAFIYSLKDISDSEFRKVILDTTVLDTSGDNEK